MVFMFNKESGYSRMLAGGFACILSRRHIRVSNSQGFLVSSLWRAGTEQEGEEEEGH